MTVLATNPDLFQTTDLSMSIIVSYPAIPLSISLTGQLGAKHFSVHVTLSRNEASPNGPKHSEGSGEPCKPERETESAAYGENGERMPYHPARPRESRSGALARDAFDRDARGPVS